MPALWNRDLEIEDAVLSRSFIGLGQEMSVGSRAHRDVNDPGGIPKRGSHAFWNFPKLMLLGQAPGLKRGPEHSPAGLDHPVNPRFSWLNPMFCGRARGLQRGRLLPGSGIFPKPRKRDRFRLKGRDHGSRSWHDRRNRGVKEAF
ncbi:MAG: hypothetical protein HY921_11485 [Elusimicrobia bacterium]|nr:hypothetical protein [Elusimicrobiota bacterium]